MFFIEFKNEIKGYALTIVGVSLFSVFATVCICDHYYCKARNALTKDKDVEK